MAGHVLASTMIAPKTFEIREYPMPDIPPDSGLLRVEATGKYLLSELCTHSYGLQDVGLAIRTVAGDGVPGGIHVSVLPWSET